MFFLHFGPNSLERRALTLASPSLPASLPLSLPPSLRGKENTSTSERNSGTETSPSTKVLLSNLLLQSAVPPPHLVVAPQAKHRIAHKPNSMPKVEAVLDLRETTGEKEGGEAEDGGGEKCVMTEEELWARLDELEKLEALQDEQDR